MSEPKKCIECGAYNGHSPKCSLMDEAYAKSELKRYYEAWLEMETKFKHRLSSANNKNEVRINRMKIELDRWKGKFLTVKHENNQLRKKLKS